jgi:multicomponent Na+:H+ antiporter subunit B
VNSIILRATSGFVTTLLVVVSVLVLVRGHNEPGGGFIGGLLAASGFAIYALANGTPASRRLLRFDPRSVLAVGLVTSILAGAAALLAGKTFLTGLWAKVQIPLIGKVSSVLVFDIGVYLVVLGTTLLILFALDEED